MHLIRFAKDRITNYSRLRQWFRRMLHWAQHNVDKNPNAKKSKHIWVPKNTQHTSPHQTLQNDCHSTQLGEKNIDLLPRKTDGSLPLSHISTHVHLISTASVF